MKFNENDIIVLDGKSYIVKFVVEQIDYGQAGVHNREQCYLKGVSDGHTIKMDIYANAANNP